MTLTPCQDFSSSFDLPAEEWEVVHFTTGIGNVCLRVFVVTSCFTSSSVFAACFALQIIFHKENPGIDYEFFIPVDKKEGERERLIEREREPAREAPRERPREREPARAPLRSKSFALQLLDLGQAMFSACFIQ